MCTTRQNSPRPFLNTKKQNLIYKFNAHIQALDFQIDKLEDDGCCTDPPQKKKKKKKGVGGGSAHRPPPVSSRFGSRLSRVADVRSHIPMTYHIHSGTQPVTIEIACESIPSATPNMAASRAVTSRTKTSARINWQPSAPNNCNTRVSRTPLVYGVAGCTLKLS